MEKKTAQYELHSPNSYILNVFKDAKIAKAIALKQPGYETAIAEIGRVALSGEQKQPELIEVLFEVMGIEGDNFATVNRDAALNILDAKAIEEILKINQDFAWAVYLDSINRQNWQNDPFSGSIATLLDAGKIMAAKISPPKPILKQVLAAWENLSSSMSTIREKTRLDEMTEDLRKSAVQSARQKLDSLDLRVETLEKFDLSDQGLAKILKVDVKVIIKSKKRIARKRLRMVKQAETEKKAPAINAGERKKKSISRPRLKLEAFDAEVEKLSKDKSLSLAEMAVILKTSRRKVVSSRIFLLSQGRVDKMKAKPLGPRKRTLEFDNKVQQVLSTGIKDNSIIAEKLKDTPERVRISRRRLYKAGRAEKSKGDTGTRKETWEFDKKVLALIKKGLENREIAVETESNVSRIKASRQRLRARRLIKKEFEKRSKTEIINFDAQVLRFQHLSGDETATKLKTTIVLVYEARQRLIKRGLLKKTIRNQYYKKNRSQNAS